MSDIYIPKKTVEEIQSVHPVGTRHAAMIKIAISTLGNGATANEVFALLRRSFPDEDKSEKEIQDIIAWCISKHPTPSVSVHKNFERFRPVIGKIKPPKERVREFLNDSPSVQVPAPVDALDFLSIYDPTDRLNIVTRFEATNGKARPIGAGKTLTVQEWRDWFREKGVPASDAGAWIRFNPCAEKGSGAGEAVTDKDIVGFKFVLIESDCLPIETQLSLYQKFRLPIAVLISSGGDSVHAWVRVKADNAEEYRELSTNLLETLKEFGFDPANKNESRLSRLPGAVRKIGAKGTGEQNLLFVNSSVVPLDLKGLEIFQESLKPLPLEHKTFRELAIASAVRYEEMHANKGKIGILTGFNFFDVRTGGLKNGQLVIIGAQTNVGKTAFALNIIRNVINQGKTVAMFSMEMSAEDIYDLILVMETRMDRNVLNNGDFSDQDLQKIMVATPQLMKKKMFIYEQPDPRCSDMRLCCRRLKAEHGLDFVVVDYLQLASADFVKENREQQVASIAKNIRAIAKECAVPVLALSQLNEDGKLRESRAIGQACDIAMLLEETDSPNRRKLVVNKGRYIPKFSFEIDFEAIHSIMTEKKISIGARGHEHDV